MKTSSFQVNAKIDSEKSAQRDSFSMSSRPTSGGRSFLDELLANDIEKVDSNKRKSVRFFDDENQNLDDIQRNRSAGVSWKNKIENKIATDKESTEKIGSTTQNVSKTSTGKADWLGLSSNDDNFSDKIQTKSQPTITMSSSLSTEQKEDWLSEGLNARRSRQISDSNKPIKIMSPEKVTDNSWLSIKKKAEDISNQKSEEQTSQKIREQKNDLMTDKIKDDVVTLTKNHAFSSSNLIQSTESSQSSALLLQTQV